LSSLSDALKRLFRHLFLKDYRAAVEDPVWLWLFLFQEYRLLIGRNEAVDHLCRFHVFGYLIRIVFELIFNTHVIKWFD